MENAVPPSTQPPTSGQMLLPFASGAKRGRKPRQRGNATMNSHFRENISGPEELAYEQDSSNGKTFSLSMQSKSV